MGENFASFFSRDPQNIVLKYYQAEGVVCYNKFSGLGCCPLSHQLLFCDLSRVILCNLKPI